MNDFELTVPDLYIHFMWIILDEGSLSKLTLYVLFFLHYLWLSLTTIHLTSNSRISKVRGIVHNVIHKFR